MNLSPFHLIVLAVCGLSIFLGLLVFSGTIPGFRDTPGGSLGTVVMWGPVPEETMEPLVNDFNKANSDQFTLAYEYHPSTSFEAELLEALATGQNPDLIIFSSDIFYRQGSKLLPIPYSALPERDFKDTFVEAGEIYLTPIGSLALPLLVDPLMMYYNRSLLSGAELSIPPATWSLFRPAVEKINLVDNNKVITRTAAAMGEFSNNRQAKNILSLLLLQAGTPIVRLTERGYTSALADTTGGTILPGQAALDYFAQFADPGKTSYSWNRSLPEARDSFAAGILATYLARASDLSAVRAKNPNLNFDITSVPQRDNSRRLTVAKVYGVGILRQAPNLQAAAVAALALASQDPQKALAQITGLPPARRDLLAEGASDAYQDAFYRSAIMSVSWVDPDPVATERIFGTATERVTTGQATAFDSINRAGQELKALLGN